MSEDGCSESCCTTKFYETLRLVKLRAVPVAYQDLHWLKMTELQ